MKLKLFFLSFFSFFLFFTFFSIKSAFANTFTLSGSVKDSSGIAIQGASISVNDINNDTTTTDSSGNYSLSVPGGTYDVQVTPPAGSNFTSAIALSQNISTNTTLNFFLTPIGIVTLSGHVYDSQGNPLPNQTIQLLGGSSPSTVSDSTGSYLLQVSPGTYNNLIFTSSNNNSSLLIPQSYRIGVANYSLTQNTILDITIPAKKVTIHVQDSSGSSISNVAITTGGGLINYYQLSIGGGITNAIATNSDYGQSGSAPVTDASGNVTLWLLPNSSGYFYNFTATPSSGNNFYTTALRNISITDDTSETITLQQPVSLSGHVYDPLGNPVANQQVRLYGGGIDQAVNTDGAGNYSIQVSPGSYGLTISANNNSPSLNIPQSYLIGIDSIILSQNKTLDITIPAKKVVIHIQDAIGNPINGISVSTSGGGLINYRNLSIGGGITNATANSSSYGQNGPAPVTDSSGNVTLWLLPNSSEYSYKLTATPPSESNYLATTLSSISVTNDTNETITLKQPVTLNGRIYDSEGNPLPNQTIQLLGGTNPSTTSDSTGSYSLQASTGTYSNLIITASNNSSSLHVPQNYRVGVANYSLTKNTSLDITIPAKKVTFHVQDAMGNPVDNISIKTSTGVVNYYELSIGEGITNAVVTQSTYGQNGTVPTTDSSGNVTLWLLPNSSGYFYNFTATPPNGSLYKTFTLDNISVISDQNELVSLQYSHATPVTTASLVTQYSDSTYSDPTNVTLSATAASGYTVANTYYTVDGGAQQTYSTLFTVSGSGDHTIIFWSVDNSGVQETHTSKTFTIHTNQPPHVTPLNSGTVNEGGTYTENGSFTDADSTSWTATVDYGDGAGEQPLTLNADKTFSLSHAYKDNGNYTMTVIVTDNQGNTGTTMTSNTVNNLAPSIGIITASVNPIQSNTSTTATASFTDPGILDTHTALWNWGDGTTSTGTVTETNGTGSIANNHTYTTAGVYQITLTVTDNDTSSGTKVYQYLSVYNPTAQGLFTAGEKYTSPKGAYTQNPTLSGTVLFGLSYKYQGTVPTGNRQFSLDFNQANLHFNATTINALVITNGIATLTGTGTVNGTGTYNFLVTGNENSNSIRIQLKEQANGTVLYDTQAGADGTAAPTTPVIGNVIAH